MVKNWLRYIVLATWICLLVHPVLRAEEEVLPVIEMSGDRVTIYPQRMELNGEETDRFPFPAALGACKPVIETVKGWKKDISGVRTWEDLPEEAKAYVQMIERAINCPIKWISVGPERESIILRG